MREGSVEEGEYVGVYVCFLFFVIEVFFFVVMGIEI